MQMKDARLQQQGVSIMEEMQNEIIYQCWSCKSVLHTSELDEENCPFCCTDIMLMDIDTLVEDREENV